MNLPPAAAEPRQPAGCCSCLITGPPRSGTSLLARMLLPGNYPQMEIATYDRTALRAACVPVAPDIVYGSHEDSRIAAVNDALLAANGMYPDFARLPPADTSAWHIDKATRQAMRELTDSSSFCYKLPGVALTIPAWRSVAQFRVLCVIRDPAATVASQQRLRETAGQPVSRERLLRDWRFFAQVILAHHDADWLVVRYEQVVSGTAHAAIEQFLQVHLEHTVPDRTRRTAAPAPVDRETRALYHDLCALAVHDA